jgi:dihydrofolate synthase / folylpolyglutamate synthase
MSTDPTKELLNELFSMTFHGIKPGLDRILHLLSELSNPQLRYPVIHVAGTNGKGSTCSMLASVLRSAGYKVGLYTSPHIRDFGERIRVNGEVIADTDILRLASPLIKSAKPVGGTFFEVTTALAFQYFAEQRVDVAVVEVGMGGRLDATNVVEPMLTVITSVDFDHTEFLGDSITKIATEKGGIIKPGIPVVVGSQDQQHANAVVLTLARIAEVKNSPMILANNVVKVDVDKIHPDFSMSVSVIDEESLHYYNVGVAGDHQASNVATTLAAIPYLQSVYFISPDQVRYGLEHLEQQSGLRYQPNNYLRCKS